MLCNAQSGVMKNGSSQHILVLKEENNREIPNPFVFEILFIQIRADKNREYCRFRKVEVKLTACADDNKFKF